MNTLTQQQINQYQWQAAVGVAIIVNNKAYNNEHDIYPSPEWDEFETFCKSNTFSTNAPDGIYSGEAFEVGEQISIEGYTEWFEILAGEDLTEAMQRIIGTDIYTCDTRQFLRLKPSHLPAVLTTQPGEEWKDRYREVEEYTHDGTNWVVPKSANELYVEKQCGSKIRTTWHLNTPPAEQEAETVEEAAEKLYPIEHDSIAGPIANQRARFKALGKRGAFKKGFAFAKSTLTQKDQRIAELERLLSKVEGYLVISNKRCKDRGDRIAELEREREWINIEDRLPEDKTKVLCVAVHPNGNRWIQIYRYSTDIGFDWMHDYEPILWIPLPTPPQH